MAELLKRDKISMKFTDKQIIDLENALKFNSDKIALTNEQLYRNKLIESYFESISENKLTISVGDAGSLFRILLENYSYMKEMIGGMKDV